MAEKTFATLEDVSRRAGVSKYTVSAVLNGTRSNTRVSTATRERILTAVRDLGYQPNAVARSLRRRRTDLIGLYNARGYFDARNRFLAEIMGGLQEGCVQFDRDLIVFRTVHDRHVDQIYHDLVDGRVDGVVLYAPDEDALAQRLAESHVPAIAIADAVPSLPSIVVDDAMGGRLQAEHLAARGHRRVLYRGFPWPARSVQRRKEAFHDTAARLGMTVLEGWPEMPDEHGLSRQERELLTLPAGERPTAAICWEDSHADRLLLECRSLGLRVPEDLAVVGFDGIPLGREPAWHLTTIQAPWASVAETAVRLLVDQMAGKDVPAETVLPVKLLVGETT